MGNYISKNEIDLLKTQIETLKIVNKQCRRDIDGQQKEIARITFQRDEHLTRIKQLEHKIALQEQRLSQVAQLVNPFSSPLCSSSSEEDE